MKFLIFSLPLIILLSACNTFKFASQPVSDSYISPLETFAVTPPTGAMRVITVTDIEGIRNRTMQAIAKDLSDKGYRQVAVDATPDMFVNSQWLVTTTNNPEYDLNAGSLDTAQQINITQQVASLEVYVMASESGKQLWRNVSPWPFSVRYATMADIENAAIWALDSFPMQLTKLEASAE